MLLPSRLFSGGGGHRLNSGDNRTSNMPPQGMVLGRQLRPFRAVLRATRSLFVLLALALFGWPSAALATPRPQWNPGPPWAPLAPHSEEALSISNLFWIMLILSAIIFIGVCAALILSAIRFTAKPDDPDPPQVYGNRRVELIWTIIPTFILMVAFVATAYDINAINTPAKAAPIAIAGTRQTILDVNAIGHQWWWEFQYPKLPGVITADEVHVPTGIPIHFHIESDDVIHSFWVPQIARQIDANPGQDNAIFVPPLTRTGIYSGACYEYCGTDHAWMKFRLVVQTPALFNAWVKQQMKPAAKPTSGLAAAGYKVFMSNTCVECHAITGTPAGGAVAPNLTHLASRWTVGAGAAPMTERDLAAWVQNPNTYKPGVLMPPYPLLSAKDLKALAAYLYSLK